MSVTCRSEAQARSREEIAAPDPNQRRRKRARLGSFQQLEVRAMYIPGYEVQNFSTTRDGIRRNGTQSSGVG